MSEICKKCGANEPCQPWNIDGEIGVPVCVSCRSKWLGDAVVTGSAERK